MTESARKIRLSNDRQSPVTLTLSPPGEDYAMKPGEQFEIVAAGAAESFYFHVCFDEGGIRVYAEGDRHARPRVYRNGEELTPGRDGRAAD